ncbi:MAG: hypothetical protein M3Q69_21265 [Acidobacteriota bacterium]|nr:hypothetical protein [Acidobacteriota bacterium]
MRRTLLFAALCLVAACGGDDPNSVYNVSRQPISVRGWVLDVKGAQRAPTAEMEIARRTELFAGASVWVENAQFASGGIAENGAFIILDVPPNASTIGFQMVGADNAKLVLQNVPGTCDVFIPDLILQPGGATVLDPKKIQVRLPDDDVKQQTPSGKTAIVAGYTVPILRTPLGQMSDRREYPSPGGFRPVATVR